MARHRLHRLALLTVLAVFGSCLLAVPASAQNQKKQRTPQELEARKKRQQEQRNAQQRERQPRIRPTHADVKYGPDPRHVLDFWKAESDSPTPLLLSIHGGGFRGGNKSVSAGLLRQCLDNNISVAAITYRLSDTAKAPAQFHDCARALQFIRSKSKEWNLDPTRVASTGGSAGAGLSLWLAFHDDLADPASTDPIARQSTRVTCVVTTNGQTSYDPRFIRDLFPGTDTYQHSALAQLFDVDLSKLDSLPAEKYRLFEEVSALPHLTSDDRVPVMLVYGRSIDTKISNQGVGIHHPRFGVELKKRMDAMGLECHVIAANQAIDAEGNVLKTFAPLPSTFEFIQTHLKAK